MPGPVRAADAPEDLWRCHECGWTYPNHHPSAKHRRNHKKQCGKTPGFMKVTDLKSGPQVGTRSSSDDGSSDEDHHRLSPQGHKKNDYVHEYTQPPWPVAATNTEDFSPNCTDPTGDPTPNNNGGPQLTTVINEKTAKGFDLPTTKVQSPGSLQASDQGRSTPRSAHAVKGQWSCRHCGWLYPNAHPSAKSRQKHKKICRSETEHSLPGGSSDEASSSDEERHCGKGRKGANIAEGVPLKSDSSYSQVPNGVTIINGGFRSNGLGKLHVGDSQVAMGDKGNIQPTVRQPPGASGARHASDVPVPLTHNINSYQSQAAGKCATGL